MKVSNSIVQKLSTRNIEEAPKQSAKFPETLAPTPDLKLVAEQNTTKSETAKANTVAQEALIRTELEQKFTKH